MGVHTSSLVRPVAFEYDQISAPADFGKARQTVAVGDRAAVPEGRQSVSRLNAIGLKTESSGLKTGGELCLLPILLGCLGIGKRDFDKGDIP
jgi:hypothetical protein